MKFLKSLVPTEIYKNMRHEHGYPAINSLLTELIFEIPGIYAVANAIKGNAEDAIAGAIAYLGARGIYAIFEEGLMDYQKDDQTQE